MSIHGHDTQVSRWGNSLGLRLPRSVAREAHLDEGDTVDVSVDSGAIVIGASRPRARRLVAPLTVADVRERAGAGEEVVTSHSARRASSGVMRAARRAGTYAATAVNIPNTNATTANVGVSNGVTPKSIPSR